MRKDDHGGKFHTPEKGGLRRQLIVPEIAGFKEAVPWGKTEMGLGQLATQPAMVHPVTLPPSRFRKPPK